jgi:predicted RNase H-like HicB family nuclease
VCARYDKTGSCSLRLRNALLQPSGYISVNAPQKALTRVETRVTMKPLEGLEMKQDTYIFPCIFIYKDTGISIYFPDLDGCVSSGENEKDAFDSAKEALSLHLYGMEQDNDPIPAPSELREVKLSDNQQAVLVEVFMPPFRARQANKYIKKTLTVPEWLNIEAERAGINFSQVLQNGLKEYLHIAH